MAHTTLRDYLQTTEDAISSGRIDNALVNCQQILQQYPNSLEAQRLLGEVYLAQGDFPKAQQAFDWVITNDPENVIAYCSRALISERMKDYDTALDCYQQAYELSRGNSQIRQEFNKLSLKVGQQQFIFSRAGLARLFMRGDLLPQATQEWENVLNANPERLDARTGLLETYWREGLYDKVEQLAHQILNDVPGCLKALLLLAHVTHAQNLQVAQQLLEQARTLDPDMVMAQEMFSDLMASQVKDPFLSLLKKAPATLGTVQLPESVANLATTTVSSLSNSSAYDNASTSSSQFSDSLLAWERLDNIIDQQPKQEASPFTAWGNHTPTELHSWSPLQDEQLPGNENNSSEIANTGPTDNETSLDRPEPMSPTGIQQDNQAQQDDIEENVPTSSTEHEQNDQALYDLETFDLPNFQNWNSLSTEPPTLDSPTSWESSSVENDVPAPPAWLEMLTGSGWKPQNEDAGEDEDIASTAIYSQAPGNPEIEEIVEVVHPLEQVVEPNLDVDSSWEEQFTVPEELSDLQDEDDVFSFGPAWLRSLGATSMDDLLPADQRSQQSISAEESLLSSQVDMQAGTTPIDEPVESFIEQPEPIQAPQLGATLETLENDLRTQGFVPLEPGMLSTIAQDQEAQQETEEEILTSSEEEIRSNVEEEEPLWPAAAQTRAKLDLAIQTTPTHVSVTVPAQLSEPGSTARAYPVQYDTLDTLLDTDLETTMKRPAVRLQAMQPRSSVPHSQSSSKRRSNEHAKLNKTSDGNVSNKERLIKGYQHQLAGSYDDAMQEYRIIVRNEPELLGEVISNLRALLKIAPKYAPGYRVLGDAYMRQGEYLQAMEAYNKALTMARKAKG